MARVFKIHPAIGIMRVGDANTFFIGPESPRHPGVEIDAAGSETRVERYKSGGRIKQQAARFRIWEYDISGSTVTPIKEVTAPATIEWTVHLVNSKGAGNQLDAVPDGRRDVLLPLGPPRNRTIS